jgi:hypothetical protein
MDKIDLKLMIHVTVEGLVIAGLAYWFHRQNVILMERVEELTKEVALHSQIINQILARMGAKPPPPPGGHGSRSNHRPKGSPLKGAEQVGPIDDESDRSPDEDEGDDDDELNRELQDVEKKRKDRAKGTEKKD